MRARCSRTCPGESQGCEHTGNYCRASLEDPKPLALPCLPVLRLGGDVREAQRAAGAWDDAQLLHQAVSARQYSRHRCRAQGACWQGHGQAEARGAGDSGGQRRGRAQLRATYMRRCKGTGRHRRRQEYGRLGEVLRAGRCNNTAARAGQGSAGRSAEEGRWQMSLSRASPAGRKCWLATHPC